MRDLAEKFFLAFIPIFVAIDPIGLVALFIGLGTSASPEKRKQQAFLGIFTACVSRSVLSSSAKLFLLPSESRSPISKSPAGSFSSSWPRVNWSHSDRPIAVVAMNSELSRWECR